MTNLRINLRFLEMEWEPSEPDKDAAWELYIELLTRVATQPLDESEGDNHSALRSIHKLFKITRKIIRRHGRSSTEFTKLAVVVLNQIVRPFTSKWHRLVTNGKLAEDDLALQFRDDLSNLQDQLVRYSQMLAQMAGVEDLTSLGRVD